MCSADEEDEDLLEEEEEGEETEEAIDELVDESAGVENNTSDQSPAALKGDQEDDKAKEIEAQKSERYVALAHSLQEH